MFFNLILLPSQRQFHIFSPSISKALMKRSHLFQGILITCLMMIFTASAAKSFSPNHAKYKFETSKCTSSISASTQGLPENRSGDRDIPQIRVATSDSSLPASFCIRNTQEIFCLFEILFEIEKFEDYQPRIPVTLNSFFLHLFRVIISPNAP